jgi:hypothetical protein
MLRAACLTSAFVPQMALVSASMMSGESLAIWSGALTMSRLSTASKLVLACHLPANLIWWRAGSMSAAAQAFTFWTSSREASRTVVRTAMGAACSAWNGTRPGLSVGFGTSVAEPDAVVRDEKRSAGHRRWLGRRRQQAQRSHRSSGRSSSGVYCSGACCGALWRTCRQSG